MTGNLTPCIPKQIEILKKQRFSDTEPGTLLKDFNSLLEFIGKTGIAVSEKTQLFAINTLPEINRVLTHSLDVKLKRPVQKSFPHINGLYLLLRSSGLSYIVPDGKKTKLMLHEDVLADWKRSLVQIERNITETGSYLFNVSLGNASCRMAVPAGISLDELAYGILEAFDFDSDHLYEFVYKNEYGVEESIAHPYADSDHEYCTADCPVGYLPLYKGMIFIFHFDFGDNWEFKIQVGAMPPTEPDYSELTIIEKRGTPPEQYADWEGGYEDDD